MHACVSVCVCVWEFFVCVRMRACMHALAFVCVCVCVRVCDVTEFACVGEYI